MITKKYNVGQTIWFKHISVKNRIVGMKVTSIRVNPQNEIIYSDGFLTVNENQAFSGREELTTTV